MALEWTKLLEWIKPKPAFIFAITLSSGVILFLPTAWLTALGLAKLREDYRPFLGGGFLLSLALLVSFAGAVLLKPVWKAIVQRTHVRALTKQLHDLTPIECAVLLEYVKNESPTAIHEISDGVVNGLVAKQILYRASNVGAYFTSFPFNIQPWARAYLQKHPHLLLAAERVRDADA